VFISEVTQRYFADPACPRLTRLIFNGLDTNVFNPPGSDIEAIEARRQFDLPASGPIALFVGRFVEKKCLATLPQLLSRFIEPAAFWSYLAALAVVTNFGVARRLWPTRLDAALISALLVATSSQVLVTSMASYAMTAHLTLNLIWLRMFLRDDKIGHGAAIAVGFLASGLHQLIFHPLFVAPFVVRLWASGRRPLALAYIVRYSVICRPPTPSCNRSIGIAFCRGTCPQ
jgi:hypothetical protein